MGSTLVSLMSFMIMFGAVASLMASLFASHQSTTAAWIADEQAAARAAGGEVAAVSASAQAAGGGTNVDVTLSNDGDLSYSEFDEWDVTVEYLDDAGEIAFRWAPYSATAQNNAWSVRGIYLDASQLTEELTEPGVFNPQEEMVLRINLTPGARNGSAGRVVVTPPGGTPASIFFAA